ncbi:pilus assembly protein TadG-related protein [Streptomyces aidingensis]|nr:pilus assembly protein TadG-related protein [Streptomyces aidingensis]
MCRRPVGDDGAAFGLFIWMVSGLLLIALTFFVFAQAAVSRSDSQSAADAAALAAVREARDDIYDDFLDVLEDEELEGLEDILDGADFGSDSACAAAAAMAAQNDAELVECAPVPAGQGYRVVVQNAVGESVIPGTEDQHARAEATAVLGTLCADASDGGDGGDDGGGEGDEGDEGEEEEEEEDEPVRLSCDDGDWEFDASDADALPMARDLFRIYLDD